MYRSAPKRSALRTHWKEMVGTEPASSNGSSDSRKLFRSMQLSASGGESQPVLGRRQGTIACARHVAPALIWAFSSAHHTALVSSEQASGCSRMYRLCGSRPPACSDMSENSTQRSAMLASSAMPGSGIGRASAALCKRSVTASASRSPPAGESGSVSGNEHRVELPCPGTSAQPLVAAA